MDYKKHVADQVWTAAEPRTARDRTRVDADSDVVSVLQSWMAKTGATADAASRHYRRGTGTGRERTV